MLRQNITGATVGIFGIGLEAYWNQFPGLKERLEGYQRHIEDRVGEWVGTVVSAGLVDNSRSAQEASNLFAREQVDLILCHAATYATSSQVLPAVQRAGAPVVVLNLQPAAAIDYMAADTGEWLANCSACCVPEISNAFERAGIPFNLVSGMLYEDDVAWSEIESWCKAAGVVAQVRGARFGFLGHTYPGMLDMYSDFTMHHAQLGIHVEVLEIDDLAQHSSNASENDVNEKVKVTRETFDIQESVEEQELEWAARVAAGLDTLVEESNLDALAYYYKGAEGSEQERLGAGVILGNSLLTARGIPASGEGDLKNAVAMKIMDTLGAGGSFTEFYAMDFNENFLLMGHDGPGHLAISDRKPMLRGLGLYHGKAGHGVSVEFNVKTGPITICAVTQTYEGKLKMLAAEGESLPGQTLEIGNTNSRLQFALPPAEFMNAWCSHGPTHHCALGTGHRAKDVEKIARLLDLEFARVG